MVRSAPARRMNFTFMHPVYSLSVLGPYPYPPERAMILCKTDSSFIQIAALPPSSQTFHPLCFEHSGLGIKAGAVAGP